MYLVKEGVEARMREEPLATSKSTKSFDQGQELGDPIRQQDGFLFFEIGAFKGWIFKDDCEEQSDAQRPPISEAPFVQECVNVQLAFNATEEIKPGEPMVPWVVSCDFLIARAMFETGIKNLGKNIPGSDAVGPLQISTAEWSDFKDNGGVLATDARPSDRDHSVLQIPGAAFRQHQHGKAMHKIKRDAGKATDADPFVPSFLDMFFAHVTNSPAAALAILDAQAAGTAPTTPIKQVVQGVMSAAELAALFQAREKLPGTNTVFFGTDASPNTLQGVVSLGEFTLKTLLDGAFAKIKQHRPDMIPTVTAGGAPWMTAAEKAAQDGVKEGSHNSEIAGTFAIPIWLCRRTTTLRLRGAVRSRHAA